jgi:glycosyltransferase involved in cell wall biosynthesis
MLSCSGPKTPVCRPPDILYLSPNTMSTIVHVASFTPEYGGNFIASLAQLRDSCRSEGWDLAFVFPEKARQRSWCKRLIAEEWRIHFLPDSVSRIQCMRALARIISEENASLVHTHFVQYDLAAWLAAHLARIRGKRCQVIWHMHSSLKSSLTILRRLTNFIKYRLVGRFVWAIAVGASVASEAVAIGYPRNRVRIAENGIDFSRLTSVAKDRLQVLADLNIKEDDRLILLFGYAPLIKGVDIAMDAMAELAKADEHVVLGIVGREPLRTYVHDRTGGQIPSWLRIFPPMENVADLYQVASLFLSASRTEGFPYAVTEAMAVRIPVIASDIPALAWAHRSDGVLFFPNGDSKALATALGIALDWSEAERKEHADANERLVRTEYGLDQWAERIMRQYKDILGK